MGNELSFSLGLATDKFLSALGGVGAAMKGFLGSVASVGAVSEGVFAQFEKGAALAHLSARTGESVKSLYALQKGFVAAGISGDEVPGMLQAIERSLGGVNEMGRPTRDVFRAMGLSVEALKQLKAPELVETLSASLGKLGPARAARFASEIAGRGGAGNLLQIARGQSEFSEGVKGASEQAAMYARTAESFRKIEAGLRAVKNLGNSLFAGIAEGAAPAVQAVLDLLKKIDLSALGKKIGSFFGLVTEAVKEGKLGELLETSVDAGFERASNYIAQVWGGTVNWLASAFGDGNVWRGLLETAVGAFAQLGVFILNIFKTPLLYLQAGIDYAIQKAMGMKVTFADVLAERKAEGVNLFGSSIDEMKQAAAEALKSGAANLKPAGQAFAEGFAQNKDLFGTAAQSKFAGLVDDLAKHIPKLSALDPEKKIEASARAPAIVGNALEKIGGLFLFGGGRSDYGQETARNTGVLVQQNKELLRRLPAAAHAADTFTNHL